MPIYRKVNHDFFKKWSSEMAYVLGYIAADGAITIGKRGNHYIDISSIDQELPKMVQEALGSDHTITQRRERPQCQIAYRIQIGSKEMVRDLSGLGFIPRKTKRLILPPGIPNKYFRDFVRGYFDGDGNISYAHYRRKDRKHGFIRWVRVLFTSSSYGLLKELKNEFERILGLSTKGFVKRNNYYILYYYGTDAVEKIFNFFYGHQPRLYLKRKFVYFKEALEKMHGPVAQPG